MKVLYLVCDSEYQLLAVLTYFRKYRIDLPFEVGLLLVPDRDGTLPGCDGDGLLRELARYVRYLMIDNGAYRHGQPLPVDALVHAYEAARDVFKNVRVALPDVLESPEETVKLHREAIRKLLYLVDRCEIEYFMPVLQGREVQDYVICFKKMLQEVYARTVPSPSLFAVGGLKVKRPSVRADVVRNVVNVLRRKYKQVHVFGADLQLIEETHSIVRSFDFANWTWEVTHGGLPIPGPTARRVLVRQDDKVWRDLPWTEKLAIGLRMKLEQIRDRIVLQTTSFK